VTRLDGVVVAAGSFTEFEGQYQFVFNVF